MYKSTAENVSKIPDATHASARALTSLILRIIRAEENTIRACAHMRNTGYWGWFPRTLAATARVFTKATRSGM
jgi:hypothetical protein